MTSELDAFQGGPVFDFSIIIIVVNVIFIYIFLQLVQSLFICLFVYYFIYFCKIKCDYQYDSLSAIVLYIARSVKLLEWLFVIDIVIEIGQTPLPLTSHEYNS